MSGFSNSYSLSPQSTSSPKSPNGLHNTTVKAERRASQSSSDEGSLVHRSDQSKFDGEQDEDGNSLTSQTLNADGTPKRPMNAFMIFARRRRPQVSAQNQSMRTGEISKILSREWVSMPPSEKQFYLEQAKQLKETFNTKYPDYVYRRRPNNSRKRRRSDGSTIRSMDHGLLADHPDDMSGSFDLDSSPTDDDQLDALSYHRGAPDIPHGALDQKFNMSQPRSSISHSYSSDHHFRSDSQDNNRLPYPGSPADRMGPGMGGNISSLPYQNSTQSSPLFGADSVGSQQGWQHRAPSWMAGGQERLPPPNPSHKNSYSSPASWSSPNEPSSTSLTSSSSSSNFFPTLNTPFYPNQQNSSGFVPSNTSHSISQQSTSTSHYESVGPNAMARDFGSRNYGSSVPSSTHNYSLSRDSFFQRTLPPMQTYSPSQPLTSGNSGPPPTSLWRD